MTHFFDDDVAKMVGVNGAILLTHIHYWVKKNADNDMNYHDGYYWTYNSVSAFKKQFPFWSARTISYELGKLESGGYIKTGCYNASAYDRTKWYTVTQKGFEALNAPILQNCNVDSSTSDKNENNDVANLSNVISQNCKMTFHKNVKSTIKQNKTKEQQQNKEGGPSRQEVVVVSSTNLCDEDLAEINKAYEQEICITPPPSHYEMLADFKEQYGAEYVIQAIKTASFNGARKLSYIKGVLENWKKEGIPKPWEKEKAKNEPQSKYIRRADGTYKLRGAW